MSRRRPISRKPTPESLASGSDTRRWPLAVAALVLLTTPVAVFVLLSQADRAKKSRPDDSARPQSRNPVAFDPPEEQSAAFARYAGSAACAGCHPEQFADWRHSHHGLAERPLDPALDLAAFDPPQTFRAGTVDATASIRDGVCQVESPGFDGSLGPWPVLRVIGETPLRQFLVDAGGGRLQTLEASYDPVAGEWFNVYGDEDRRVGEWGHWTGRGMNWNSMCASCHNTRLRKNYRPESDSYETAMAEMSVSCESCHGPMKDHSEWRLDYPESNEPDPTLRRQTIEQISHSCAACHSRRSELTGDFAPGDSYFDHHSPAIPDASELYFADGQVREENYVFSSFLSSRMHAAGVHCLDCHQPHSAKLNLAGNELCLRCHQGNYPDSPVIDVAAHTFHAADSAGSLCVNCHMPETVYMQRDPRRDHAFTIPDPLLTKELGIPNACNRCHSDQSAEWALEAVEKWYGDRMERPSRERARTVARARRADPAAREPLLEMLRAADPPFWQGVAAELSGPWLADPEFVSALGAALQHPLPLVRGAAARSLDPLAQIGVPGAITALEAGLEDPSRMVRVLSAYALRSTVDPASTAGKELLHYFDHIADQPTGQAQRGSYLYARGNMSGAAEAFHKAVKWDPGSAAFRHELAVILSSTNRSREAVEQLEEAVRLEPENAEFHYKLALGWNELGDLNRAVAALRQAVQLDTAHDRAWYNLGLALNEAGKPDDALEALQRAGQANPADPRIPQAVSAILASLGRTQEAALARQMSLRLEALREAEAARLRGPVEGR
ncbi:MAG TPA: ammonia-forming cytochrome c nitrite reductase subunit c552 [Verrucomicrobiales bacterium]|nr:ammonia-forming cytochrome c nitrite reductase subunit c552 [Verrucomicrobiales bacterium]